MAYQLKVWKQFILGQRKSVRLLFLPEFLRPLQFVELRECF